MPPGIVSTLLAYHPQYALVADSVVHSGSGSGYLSLRERRERRDSRRSASFRGVLWRHPAFLLQIVSVRNRPRCGVLEVPENPDQPAGRQLKIGVAVIPAIGGKPSPDPIAVLMGGPGESAIGAAEIYAEQFTTLRHDRDILLVDRAGYRTLRRTRLRSLLARLAGGEPFVTCFHLQQSKDASEG